LAIWCEGAGRQKNVAFVLGRCVADEAEILRLAVDQANRRKGLATFLLNELKQYLLQQSCKICHLEVRSSNFAALQLYVKNGFEEVGRRPGYYRQPDEDAVLMALKL